MAANNKIRMVWLAALLGILVWNGAVFLAPLLRGRGHPLSALIYAAFAPTCHQLPGRSFYLCGFPLPVCGRCLGIYAGFLLGVLAYPFVRGFSRARLEFEHMPPFSQIQEFAQQLSASTSYPILDESKASRVVLLSKLNKKINDCRN